MNRKPLETKREEATIMLLVSAAHMVEFHQCSYGPFGEGVGSRFKRGENIPPKISLFIQESDTIE